MMYEVGKYYSNQRYIVLITSIENNSVKGDRIYLLNPEFRKENDSKFSTIIYMNQTKFKKASTEEINWLDACIKAGKFVPKEEIESDKIICFQGPVPVAAIEKLKVLKASRYNFQASSYYFLDKNNDWDYYGTLLEKLKLVSVEEFIKIHSKKESQTLFKQSKEFSSKKGDTLYCHTSLVMNSGKTAAIQGKTYYCERDGVFTNEQGNKNHGLSNASSWFTLQKDVEIKSSSSNHKAKVGDTIRIVGSISITAKNNQAALLKVKELKKVHPSKIPTIGEGLYVLTDAKEGCHGVWESDYEVLNYIDYAFATNSKPDNSESDKINTMYIPRPGDYVVITNSSEWWTQPMNKYVGQCVIVESVEIYLDCHVIRFKNDGTWIWAFERGHFRKASYQDYITNRIIDPYIASNSRIPTPIEEIHYIPITWDLASEIKEKVLNNKVSLVEVKKYKSTK